MKEQSPKERLADIITELAATLATRAPEIADMVLGCHAATLAISTLITPDIMDHKEIQCWQYTVTDNATIRNYDFERKEFDE